MQLMATQVRDQRTALTMAVLLLVTSAFSTKPNFAVMSSGSAGGCVTPCISTRFLCTHAADG